MKARMLVTATGGSLAALNIRLLKQSQRHDVWVLAVDTRVDATGQYFADAFSQVPSGTAPNYVDVVLSLIERYSINLILPWSDEEALALAEQRERIEGAGAILACAPFSTLQKMSDKTATYDVLANAGIPVPLWVRASTQSELMQAVENFTRNQGEFVVKPTSARGNRGTIVVRRDVIGVESFMASRELHMDIDSFVRDHLRAIPLPAIVMERLFPPAYDIDVLSRNGQVLRAMPRQRLNPAGVPFAGSVLIPSGPLFDLAERITSAFHLSWLYDYDLMTDASGQILPIEINPRPSGSIAAAILAGAPFYDDLIALANNEPVQSLALLDEVTVIPYTDCYVIPTKR